MFKLNEGLLKDRGIRGVKNYVMLRGMNNQTVVKWLAGRVRVLSLDVLWRMCRDLNCTPNDLLVPREDVVKELPEGHALRKLVREAEPEIGELVGRLTVEELAALKEQLRGGKAE